MVMDSYLKPTTQNEKLSETRNTKARESPNFVKDLFEQNCNSPFFQTISKVISSIGYLSAYPYQAKNELHLNQHAENHQCPCCFKNLIYDLTSKQTLIRSHNKNDLLSAVEKCECGFIVPFHVELINFENRSGLYEKSTSINQAKNINLLPLDAEAAELECRYLLNIGSYKNALRRLSRFEKLYPSLASIPFYSAYAFEKLGLFELALKKYDICLDFDPECEEAWHNKSMILAKLKRDDEANFNIVKYCQLNLAKGINKDQKLYESVQAGKTLKRTKGKFGDSKIIQTTTTRYLSINREIEGSFWLLKGQPSNVPAGVYVAGFLLAGCHFQANSNYTTGLMPVSYTHLTLPTKRIV